MTQEIEDGTRVRVHHLFGETRNATIVFSESKRGRTWYRLAQFTPVIRDRSGTPMPEWAGWWERHEFDLAPVPEHHERQSC